MKMMSDRKKARGIREFLYVLPFIIVVAIFCYYPLYGWRYAFYNYKPPFPLSSDDFVGTKWFSYMFTNPIRRKQILQVLLNTFGISGFNMLFSWFPMMFAIFLNEIKWKPYQKFVQTVTTIPNFISWVLVYSIAYCVFNSTGVINSLLQEWGFVKQPIMFLQSSEHIWFKMWLWNTWKNAGWAAIMYIAAITSIDEELIDAARVDGANRWKIILHITIPSILPTFFVLQFLNMANFLSNGMEQFFVFENSFNTETIQVLDLYVYNLAMKSGGYSLSVAIGMLKSLVSLVLLCIMNTISKLTRGEGFI